MWFKENFIIYLAIFFVNCEHLYPQTIKNDEDRKTKILEPTQNSAETIKQYKEFFEEIRPNIRKDIQTSLLSESMANNKYVVPKTMQAQKVTAIIQESDGLKNKINIRQQRQDNIRITHPTIFQRPKQLQSNGTKSRFLEVFQIVEFDHVSCTSSSGLDGICLHEYKCHVDGGAVIGTCADGYGVCCVNLYTCEGSTSTSTSWFTNPDFPSPSTGRMLCTFTLNKATDEIKQIRLDFLSFEMLPPAAGACQQDQFVISGQNMNSIIPILCGINTGQHVYLEVSDVDGPIHFSIQTISLESRLFSIKVSQLTSADDLAAPTGCLQYFKDSEGFLESFNYRDISDIAAVRVPSYSNNLNYAICIQRAAESCSVTYTTAGDMQIVNYDLGKLLKISDGLPIIPPNQAGVEIYNCPSDYLLISATRLCGDRLNDGSILQDLSLDAPITDSSAGPIVIWFRSDEGYVGRGFKLKYKQNSCSTPEYKRIDI
ncbi:hypothetical protein K1T71_001271 [Dendrolimus kikuchii]|uniref:Uncharacterized protein n=1 Tax=Dendrolimus kikuchii TaxID=765133 RepID=A0ACC1DHM2_9NEOP|nr:hypothetical protein K1T71_001271 [Dendrolimus kikuchii]